MPIAKPIKETFASIHHQLAKEMFRCTTGPFVSACDSGESHNFIPTGAYQDVRREVAPPLIVSMRVMVCAKCLMTVELLISSTPLREEGSSAESIMGTAAGGVC